MNSSSNVLLNKSHLVDSVRKMNPKMSAKQVKRVVNLFFDEIANALICGDRVELNGLDSVIMRKKVNTYTRNPKTNEKMLLGRRGVMHLRASKKLLNTLNATNDNHRHI